MLDAIDPRERGALLQVGVRRRFGRGEVVFHEGDPGDALHIVTAGVFVARGSSTMGEVIAVNVFAPGDVFGELVLLTAGARRSATVAALCPSATLMVAQAHFEALRTRVPSVDRILLSLLAQRNRALTAHLIELQFTPADQRVVRRLLDFHAMTAEDGGWVRLNQAELATLAGTTRSTANRVLRAAAARGEVELGRGRVRVLDLAGLRRAAGLTARAV
jgi:CRP/FNR family transcriptional regulator, cyclic AMP receptor protein